MDFKETNFINSICVVKEDALLFNNLLLLGLDLIEMKSKYQLDFQMNTFAFEGKNNQKILAFIVNFLLNKITEGLSVSLFNPFFPVRTSTDYLGFKKEAYALLQNLEKQGKIPRNFILSKSILETTSGEPIINFLRFLSEFTIRFILNRQYPLEKIEIFEFNRHQRSQEINHIYEISSNMDETLICSKIPDQCLSIAIKACYIAIQKQRGRFYDIWNKFNLNTDIWNKIAQNFIGEFQINKKKMNELNEYNKLINEVIPANFLKDFRALDRIQLIDLSRAFFQETKKISEEVIKKNSLEKIEDFYNDSNENNLLNKITKENLGKGASELIDLTKVYEKWNICLENTKEEIPDEEQVIELVARLKETKNRISSNHEKIIKFKQNFQAIRDKYSL